VPKFKKVPFYLIFHKLQIFQEKHALPAVCHFYRKFFSFVRLSDKKTPQNRPETVAFLFALI